jgi:hypothetical protein
MEGDMKPFEENIVSRKNNNSIAGVTSHQARNIVIVRLGML